MVALYCRNLKKLKRSPLRRLICLVLPPATLVTLYVTAIWVSETLYSDYSTSNCSIIDADNVLSGRPPVVRSLNCRKLFENDRNYVAAYTARRITLADPAEEDLPMDCDSIRTRNYFPTSPNSQAEFAFPLAEARAVYKDYLFVEMELAAGYAPQNWYCFSVDLDSDALFRRRMKRLAKCLPNVLLADQEYKMDRFGHNMTTALLKCLEALNRPSRRWNYVTLLQNHDVGLKTNREAVQIFQWLNGVDDVEAVISPRTPRDRFDYSQDWSFKALNIFRNVTRNQVYVDGFPPRLQLAGGPVQCSLTRATVDYMLNTLDLRDYLHRIDVERYLNVDELMFPTLYVTDALGLPGGFTHTCLEQGLYSPYVTRIVVWDEKRCLSGRLRHLACIFGVENLSMEPQMPSLPQLFVNKLMPEFDFGAIACWHEEVFRRSYVEPKSLALSRLNETFYRSLAHVQFHEMKLRAQRSGRPFHATNVDCSHMNTVSLTVN